MTDSMSSLQDGSERPIDAEFEPATPRAKQKQARPGWVADLRWFGIGALVTAVIIAAISGLVPGLPGHQNRNSQLRADITGIEGSLETIQADMARLNLAVDEAVANSASRNTLTAAETEKLSSLSRSMSTVQARLNSLQTETDDLRTALDQSPSASSDNQVDAALMARIETLEQALAVQALSAPALSEPVVEVEPEISEPAPDVTAAPASEPLDADEIDHAEAALALSAIETAARRGSPFQIAYQRLVAAMPGEASLSKLAPVAVTGAPTLSELRDQFTLFKRAALDQDAKTSGAGPSWMRTIFGDGITVRRADAISAAERLDTVEAALTQGDLSTAITEITALEPDVQAVFTDWLNSARNRQTLEVALEDLRLAMIAKDRP